MRLRLDEILEHPWVTNLPELLPMYKQFMRSVQCVRWYEAELRGLRASQGGSDASVGGKINEYEAMIAEQENKQPDLLRVYQQAKEELVGGGGNRK